jgi:DNA-binding CsgD family transcriptional regulator
LVVGEIVLGVVASSRTPPAEQAAFFDEFERMLGTVDARPQVVIDRDMRVVWQSDNAGQLLVDPVPLQLAAGAIAADTAAGNAALSDFTHNLGGDCDSLLLRGQSRRHWAMLLAWCPRDHPELVCLLVNLSVPHRGVQESGLARALRLTAAETRVLDQFAQLNSPREIADRMQVSLSTVRSHLKQIHSKAGVETAVQLTQLVRGFCSC